MAALRTKLWDLEPHTEAKHEILQRYLQAWTRILTHGGFPEIMYVDGFAGPGRYSNGEDRSPLIALRAALAYRQRITGRIRFVLIERDVERARQLRESVGDVEVPANFLIQVIGGETLEVAFGRILHSYRTEGRQLPPTFAFVDPFGWSGVPFSIVQEIMKTQVANFL